MKTKIIILIYATLLFSCKQNKQEQIVNELLNVDKEFSALSVEKGKNHAFLTYMHKDVTILENKSMPIEGKETVAKMYENEPDSDYTLKWKPLRATAAASGDLGYTYGMWMYSTSDTSLLGTYITIWKKNEQGAWKFILDTGNVGLGKDEEKEKEQF
ncbi:MAG: hypothetical protein P1P88_07485 [Bacteroidales bacterium]|nr:hypothetical protein [Bacteroidales bacterium]